MARYGYNPCSYLPRRLQIVSSLTIFVLLTIIFFNSTSDRATHYREELSEGARRAVDYIPENISRQFSDSPLNPFRVPAHKPPPEQANSTSADISWFSDWKWRNPFSHSISYDDRAVLPPEAKRTPVYTYYDYNQRRDRAEKEAEHDLLVTWRKAWWAKGFRPIVLGRSEAVNNPLYRNMQALSLKPALEADLLRWLAWGNMGTGLLSNYLAVPMCDYDDDMMIYLRNGEFPDLTRFKGLYNGFFVGEKKAINEAVKEALSQRQMPEGDSLTDILRKTVFKVESGDAIAFYGVEAIQKKYSKLYEKLRTNAAEGKIQLRTMIEAHLQSTWQSLFPDGITVLQPIVEVMTIATEPAMALAGNLSTCLQSPYPAACPPNIANCKPCLPDHPIPVNTLEVYRNETKTFTIGTVPHPYTMNSLIKKQTIISTRYIRRETVRDNYISAVSAEALGTGRSSYERIVYMKDAVASESGKAHSLWVTAERAFDIAWREDVSWNLGFPIPSRPVDSGKSETPVPGPERRVKPQKKKGKFRAVEMPDELGLKKERALLEESRGIVKKRDGKANRRLTRAMEDWNLADTELWHFVRAFAAQRRMERKKWEEEERKFAGGERRGSWGRWGEKDDED